jgi:hypothetical protein
MLKKTIAAVIAVAIVAIVATRSDPTPESLAVQMTIQVGGESRTHEVVMLAEHCGRVEAKAPAHEDFIMVCAHPSSQGMRMNVSWRTRNGTADYRVNTDVDATRGELVDFGGGAGTRFLLQYE